jgi:Xaa-Pro aminopeptidase
MEAVSPTSTTALAPAGFETYVHGELGIRHEDTVVVTENGCENLAPKARGRACRPDDR